MKKLISIFLVLILSVSVTYGAEYEIKWKEGFEDLHIRYVEADSVLITDGVFFRGLYDMDLNMISDGMYHYMIPLDNEGNYFVGSTTVKITYGRKEGKDYTFTDNYIKAGERIIENDEILEKAKEYCDSYNIPYEHNRVEISLIDIYDKNGNRLSRATDFGFESQEALDNYNNILKIRAVLNKEDAKYALVNSEGTLTDYEFTESISGDSIFREYIQLENEDKAIFGNPLTGNWRYADSIEQVVLRSNYVIGFVEKTKDGKYRYHNSESEPLSDLYFDEYLGYMGGSASFKKDGVYYVFNTQGELSYSGKEKIKAVFYENYVREKEGKYGLYDKNGSNIIPPLYKLIMPLCRDVYYVKDENSEYIYNQKSLILTGIFNITNDETMFLERNKYIVNESSTLIGVFDNEGNKIYETDKYEVDTNGIDIFVTDRENNRIGKVILKDSNPNVRINGKLLVSDTMPRIKNGRTLVPLRALAEETGFEVSYNEETKEINITNKDKIISFKIGEEKAYKNGEEIILEAPPEIINNRTLVPLRAVSDAFGYDISWNAGRRLAEITE